MKPADSDVQRAAFRPARLLTPDNSIHVEDNAKILFDFQSGQLYVTSPLHLWRGGAGREGWLTDDDFKSVLNSLERAGARGI